MTGKLLRQGTKEPSYIYEPVADVYDALKKGHNTTDAAKIPIDGTRFA